MFLPDATDDEPSIHRNNDGNDNDGLAVSSRLAALVAFGNWQHWAQCALNSAQNPVFRAVHPLMVAPIAAHRQALLAERLNLKTPDDGQAG
jgi:hypothetical protein